MLSDVKKGEERDLVDKNGIHVLMGDAVDLAKVKSAWWLTRWIACFFGQGSFADAVSSR